MNYQNIHVNGNRMEPNRIYAGTRGSYVTDVSFSFSGEWEGLTKKLIFYPVRGTPVYTVYTYGTVRIPARVMRNAGISVMLISGYRVTEDGKIGEKIITASASVMVESAESDIRNEPDIPEATVFEEIVAKLGAPYIGESGNWYIWDVDTHEFVDTGLPSRGEKGETGRGLTILGKYSSLDELRASVKNEQPGDAYSVGPKAPYTIYIWDEVVNDFTDHGDLRGIGISEIKQITDNTGSGEANTIRITTDDGAQYDCTVYNGERGHPGNIWIGETEPPDDSYTIWLNPGGAVSGFVENNQGAANAGRALVVGADGIVRPGSVQNEAPVTSVNKKTGAVMLGAGDVGAPTLTQFEELSDEFHSLPKADWIAKKEWLGDTVSGFEKTVYFSGNKEEFYPYTTFSIQPSIQYSVLWDGVAYGVVGRAYEYHPYLGNGSLVFDGAEDTGEPFCFSTIEYSDLCSKVTKSTSDDEEITFKVVTGNYISFEKLPSEFLPDGVVKKVNGAAPDQYGNVTISAGGADFETDKTLTLKGGVLSVNTAEAVEQDNTLPITSAAVYQTVGNIENLLKTI